MSQDNEIRSLVRASRIGSRNQILLLTIDRPRRANAYTQALLEDFAREVGAAEQSGDIRAAILTGAGDRSFCAGADFGELADRRGEDALDLRSRSLFDLWAETPWPTIAAINGPAVAGGFELALACDIRVSVDSATFSLPEPKLGLLPAAGGLHRLPMLVGPARAKEMILFGRKLDAHTALDWGLVAHVGQDYFERAVEYAEYVSELPCLVTRLAKRLLNAQVQSNTTIVESLAQALLYDAKVQSSSS